MRFTLGGLFAEAASLWRRERELVVPVTGVFAFLPVLGWMLLMAAQLPREGTVEEAYAAILAFQSANVLPLLLGSLWMSFGSFALFNIFLQGEGRTLGSVLMLSLRRFLPFFAIDWLIAFAFGLGLSLLILPGLFVLGRTWLIAPAFAATPEQGPLGAVQRGWRLAGGMRWLVLLGGAAIVLLAASAMLIVATLLIGVLVAATGVGELLGHATSSAIVALGWAQITVLRVAAYRLASNGI